MPYKRDIAKALREQECRVAGAYAGRRAGLQKDGEGDSESGRGEKRHRKARGGAHIKKIPPGHPEGTLKAKRGRLLFPGDPDLPAVGNQVHIALSRV